MCLSTIAYQALSCRPGEDFGFSLNHMIDRSHANRSKTVGYFIFARNLLR